MKKSVVVLLVFVAFLGALLLWMWGGYNGLVSADVRVENAWADVQSQYQRRFDLIPNLVNTVKGAAAFEQNTFTGVTEARTKWLAAETPGAKIAAAQELESSLSRLLVTVENYPQLQATQAFRDLMTQLEGTENRIAVSRRDYNGAVGLFNLAVRRFPGNILASVFGFDQQPFFEAVEQADEAPAVQF